MNAHAPRPPAQPEARVGSAVVRVGTAAGAGALAALVCALPAALRVSGAAAEGPGTFRSWMALASACLVPMVGAVVVLRGAREGLRAFGGPGAGLRAYGLSLWLASTLVGLALLGSVLRATTHHHALAGVTYAFASLVLAGGNAIICSRIVEIARYLPRRGRRVLLPSLGVAVGIILFAVGVRFVRVASRDAASHAAAGTVVDVLAFALAAVFASRRGLAGRRLLAVVGPPVALVIAMLGLAALHDRPTREAIAEHAPAFAPLTDLLSGG